LPPKTHSYREARNLRRTRRRGGGRGARPIRVRLLPRRRRRQGARRRRKERAEEEEEEKKKEEDDEKHVNTRKILSET